MVKENAVLASRLTLAASLMSLLIASIYANDDSSMKTTVKYSKHSLAKVAKSMISPTPPIVGKFKTPAGGTRGMTFDGTYLWSTDDGDRIYKLDPVSGSIIASFAAPGVYPGGIAWDGTYLWISDFGNLTIYKMDPKTLAVISSFPAVAKPFGIASDGQFLYVVEGSTIYKINPSTGAQVGSIPCNYTSPNVEPFGLAYLPRGTAGQLWVCDGGYGSNIVSEYDLASGVWFDQWPANPTVYPCGLAYDPATGRMWVPCWTLDSIYIYQVGSTGTSKMQLIPIASPTYNRRPVFAWHTVPNAKIYTLQIASDIGYSNMVIAMPTTDTVFTPLLDLPIGPIYWRVKADSTSYAPSMFVILDNRIPIIIPYQPKMTLERRPTLRWHPVSGASSYTIVIDDAYTFLTPIITAPVSDTFFTCTADLPIGVICWKVQSNLVATFSSADTFQVVTDTVPYLIRFNGATLATPRPDFLWRRVPLATTYTIAISTTLSFLTPILIVPLSDTSYVPLMDLAGGKYFWRVSSDRNGLYSPPDSFVISSSGIDRNPRGLTPNAKGFLTISAGQNGVVVHYALVNRGEPVFELYNLKGKLVYETALHAFGGALVLAGSDKLPCGKYFAVLKAEGERHETPLILLR